MKSLRKHIIIGIIFSIILGVLLHYLYDFLDQNHILGYFSAINESAWEHVKLSVYPLLLTTLIIYLICRNDINNLLPSLAIAAVLPIAIIMLLFLLYVSFTKKAVLPTENYRKSIISTPSIPYIKYTITNSTNIYNSNII